MKQLLIGILFLSCSLKASDFESAVGKKVADYLESLEQGGTVKKLLDYDIKGSRFSWVVNGQKKHVSNVGFDRIQIPTNIWKDLTRSEKRDFLLMLQQSTRVQKDKDKDGASVKKYVGARKDNRKKIIIFIAPIIRENEEDQNIAPATESFDKPIMTTHLEEII